MSSRYEAYRVDTRTQFDAALWNRIVRDVDTRLVSVEDKKASFEEAERTLLDVGLRRINETIQPAAERIQRISELGFLIASSDSVATAVEGVEVSLVIRDGDQRPLFTPSPWVAMIRRSTPDDFAVCRSLAYSSETGILLMEVASVTGNGGPHDDWDVVGAAGVVMAQAQMLEDATGARDLARDWAEQATDVDVDGTGTRSAKHHALAAASSAGAASASASAAGASAGIAAGAKTAAEGARNVALAAQEAAEIAATAAATTLADKLDKSGDTMTGPLTLDEADLIVLGPAATWRGQRLNTDDDPRWFAGMDPTAESGADAGSDYVIARYKDNGDFAEVVRLFRDTGSLRAQGAVSGLNGVLSFSRPVFTRIKTTYIEGSTTFTPDANTLFAEMEVKGAGGGGGGVYNTTLYRSSAGSGGGEGMIVRAWATKAQLPASIPITIGAGGAPGVYNAGGGNGGATTVGSLLSAGGGIGGAYAQEAVGQVGAPGIGGYAWSSSLPAGQAIGINGAPGSPGFLSSDIKVNGVGGSGGGAGGGACSFNADGGGGSRGGGGAGGHSALAATAKNGGGGGNAYCIFREYLR